MLRLGGVCRIGGGGGEKCDDWGSVRLESV